MIWISENTGTFRDGRGQLLGYEGMVQDITERKQAEVERQHLEEQLLQAQKMESIGTLAGGVAHDFNNLLTVIIGNTQLTRADLGPDNPLQANLVGIENAANRAASLLGNCWPLAAANDWNAKRLISTRQLAIS